MIKAVRFLTRRKIFCIIAAAVNLAALAAAALLTLAAHHSSRAQRYNFAYESWSQGKGGYAQISCFFSDNSGFGVADAISLRRELVSSLGSAGVQENAGTELCPTAYSTPAGSFQVSSGRRFVNAEITVEGGWFFLFRGFDLIDGAYPERDQADLAVIDRALSFRLFGSEKSSGLDIFISGKRYTVAGVADLPRTAYERECAGEIPRVYIPYAGAAELFPEAETFDRVSCCEIIAPEPVSGFVSGTAERVLGSYSGNFLLVDNSRRFSTDVRMKAAKKLSRSAVRTEPVVLPYWENASRIAEYKVTRFYTFRRAAMCVPCISIAVLFILLLRLWNRKKHLIYRKTADLIYSLRCRLFQS